MTDGNNSEAEKIISDMRQKIISVKTEEKILASKRDELHGMLSRLDSESTSGFAREIDEIRKEDTDSGRETISEQMQRVSRLIGRAGRLALDVAAANNISLDGNVQTGHKRISQHHHTRKRYAKFMCANGETIDRSHNNTRRI